MGEYIELPGVKTWYDVEGQGEPVLLLHGDFVTNETWGAQRADSLRITESSSPSGVRTDTPPTSKGGSPIMTWRAIPSTSSRQLLGVQLTWSAGATAA